MFGCGSKGIELVKQLFLMGVGKGQNGHIYLIDDSKIRLYSLASHFLFK